MGYYEIPCQICGVSFNINRIRTSNEPRCAAWGHWKGTHYSWVEAAYVPPSSSSDCDEDTGCQLVYHGHRDPSASSGALSTHSVEDEDNDPDYEPPVEMDLDGIDSLEYASNASEHERAFSQGSEVVFGQSSWTADTESMAESKDVQFLPLSTTWVDFDALEAGEASLEAYNRARKYEHIAGAECRSTQGYQGHRISADEMRGCRTVQGLVMKGPNWKPTPDDLPFEGDSKCHLTGLAPYMPSGGWGIQFTPARHGVETRNADLSAFTIADTEELDDIVLPFHPACLELFCQASCRLLGEVDVDGLMEFRNQSARNGHDALPMERHPDVEDGLDQVWCSNIGDEYLAANPVLIPALPPILHQVVDVGNDFDVDESPFARRRSPVPKFQNSTDPFCRLPQELIFCVIHHLGSKDIAELRLTSRAFTHLPNSLWYRLVLDELPWLYEAWSSDPEPSLWVTKDAIELYTNAKNRDEALLAFTTRMENLREVAEEEMPEALQSLLADEGPFEWPQMGVTEEVSAMLKLRPIGLPYLRTDWYSLYCKITSNWKVLRGLQNRARIWDDVQKIVHAIRELNSQ
ncbi:Fc.00g115550.m01.CDS01 [Cosmosporella sp. VM-42]